MTEREILRCYCPTGHTDSLSSLEGAVEAAGELGVDTISEYRPAEVGDIDLPDYVRSLWGYLQDLLWEDESLVHENGGARLDDLSAEDLTELSEAIRTIVHEHLNLSDAAWQYEGEHSICRLCRGDVLFGRGKSCDRCAGSGLEPADIEEHC